MITNYTTFIDRVIHRYEGGYGWNPHDAGGPTKYGITCYDLAEHRGLKMTSMAKWAEPVKSMTMQEAEDIYRAKYAAGIRFNDLPTGVDCCMLDYGINSGVSRPVRVGRALVGLPVGGMDDNFIAALKKTSPKVFVDHMNAERLRFMHAIKDGASWAQFGHGWQARVDDLSQYCNSLIASVAPAPAPDLSNVVTPKAKHVGNTAPKTTAGGAIGTAAALHQSGFHWPYIAAGVASVVVAGIGYEIVSEHRAKVANNTVHI
jgi:lysozyme family protein